MLLETNAILTRLGTSFHSARLPVIRTNLYAVARISR
jgi:hypothetical protein